MAIVPISRRPGAANLGRGPGGFLEELRIAIARLTSIFTYLKEREEEED